MESEKTNFVIDGLLTPETIKQIFRELVPAVTKLLQPYLDRLEFLSCSGVPQDGRRLNLSGLEFETYKLRSELEIIMRGDELYG